MYDTGALMEINLNRVRSHDDIFEALFELMQIGEYDIGNTINYINKI
jgi:hypothetical protein